MNEWAPAEESRSSSDRWVNPKKWTERAEKGRKFKSWRGRILSSPVSVGYEIWGEDGKPSRAKTAAGLAHIKPRQDGKFGPDKIKRQWAIAFGDVEAGQVVVWTIHQKMIQDGLAEKVTKWGKPENANEPFGYDVVVDFKFAPIDLRPEVELESFKSVKQARILEQLFMEEPDRLGALHRRYRVFPDAHLRVIHEPRLLKRPNQHSPKVAEADHSIALLGERKLHAMEAQVPARLHHPE